MIHRGTRNAFGPETYVGNRLELRRLCERIVVRPLKDDQIHIDWFGHDPRTGWDTFIVTVDKWGVVGLLDADLKKE
jgi:hypothetical protein